MDSDKNNPHSLWYYDVNPVSRVGEPAYGRAKAFLYDRLYSSITRHDLFECYKLLRLIPREMSFDPYVLFRFIFILISSVETDGVNKNFLTYLETLLAKLNLSKPEAFLEFVAYFIRHNRFEDAKELFAQRQRSIAQLKHRYVPFVDVNICCYKFLINYHEWKVESRTKKVRFDYSIQGWLVNAMDGIRKVSSNYEYFAMAIEKVLLFYSFNKKAYLFMSEFQRTNPDNLTAQLMLFKLVNMLTQIQEDRKVDKLSGRILTEEERIERRLNELSSINNFDYAETCEYFDVENHPLTTDRRLILSNLARLDKTRFEILELSADVKQIDGVQLIMDSLEYIQEMNSIARWQSLQNILHEILSSGEEQSINELRTLWQMRYQRFWNLEYFLEIVGNNFPTKDLIEDVLRLLSSQFDISEDMFAVFVDDDDVLMDIC